MNNQIFLHKQLRYDDISLRNESLVFNNLTSKRVYRGLEKIFMVKEKSATA